MAEDSVDSGALGWPLMVAGRSVAPGSVRAARTAVRSLAAALIIFGLLLAVRTPGASATTSARQTEANAHLLALSDLPAGWTAEKSKPSQSSVIALSAPIAGCVGAAPALTALQPPQGNSRYFDSKDNLLEVQYTDYVFARATDAAATLNAVASAKTASCVAAFANGAGKSELVGPLDLDKGDSVGTITVAASNPAHYGSNTTGFVLTIPLNSRGIKLSVQVASIYDLHGPLLEQFTFTGAVQPFPVSLSTRLVALQAARAAAPTGAAAVAPASAPTVPAPPMQPDPPTTPGPEGIAIPIGPQLAGLATAATGATIDGIQCQTNEQTVAHFHSHLTIFVNGQAQTIPYGIGIPDPGATRTPQGFFVQSGSCFYWLHTHAEDGIIHIESPGASVHFTLGEFFAEWGQPLSATQVGPAMGTVSAFVNGQPYMGDPRTIPLGNHTQIQLNVGTPAVTPVYLFKWGGL
jgi:hypothetical protein